MDVCAVEGLFVRALARLLMDVCAVEAGFARSTQTRGAVLSC